MVLEEYGLPKRALFLCRCLRKAESWCHSKNMGRAGELGNWLFKLSFIKGYALPKMFQNRIWLLTCFVSFILILRSIYPISRKVGNIFLAAGKAQGLCCWVTGSRQVIIFVKCNNIAFGTEENLIWSRLFAKKSFLWEGFNIIPFLLLVPAIILQKMKKITLVTALLHLPQH